MNKEEKKQVWLSFSSSALCGILAATDVEQGIDVDDVVDDAAGVADVMLEEYEARFGGGSGGSRRNRRRRKGETEDDAEDEQ